MRRLILLLALTVCLASTRSAGAIDGTILVSLGASGATLAGGSGSTSSAPAVTADATGVAFEALSRAVPSDVNATTDVFFREIGEVDAEGIVVREARTTLLSIAADGRGPGNNRSFAPAASDDGRRVAFASLASDLVEGDENGTTDVFLRNREAEQTLRLSAPAGGDANGPSHSPAISADGQYAAFCSEASNLVEGDDNGVADAFIVELETGAMTRVAPADALPEVAGGCVRTALSNDGGSLAYTYRVAGDGQASAAVFLYERASGASTRVAGAGSGTNALALSGGGEIVLFDSEAADLVAGDTNRVPDLFAWEADGGRLTRLSVSANGAEGNKPSGLLGAAISADGRYVAYSSAASNLVPGDGNGAADVFRLDRETGELLIVSMAETGVAGNGPSYSPQITDDGQNVAYVSGSSNIVFGDRNNHPDIYLRGAPFSERAGPDDLPLETPNPDDFVGPPVSYGDDDGGLDPLLIGPFAAAALALVLIAGWFLLGRAPKA